MEKQYNYFYKIENTLNGKFYYGVHGTDNLADGYLGSGKRILYAVKKYSKENFKKEILIFFETYKNAMDYEVEIVNEELLLDPSCYNIMPGGKGGFVSNEAQLKRSQAGTIAAKLYRDNNPDFVEKMKELSSNTFKRLHKEGKFEYDKFRGKQHTKETKELIGSKNKVKQMGSGNSQYGTCWITNEKENKKIHRGDLIPDGWKLGRILVKLFH